MPYAVCPPDRKQARFADSGGMYLQVSPAGSKRWFLKYRVTDIEKRLALGSYPDIDLKAARKARDAAKLQKFEGRDPLQVRKVEKLREKTLDADMFKVTALEWYAMKLDSWSSHHAIKEKRNLEKTCSHSFQRGALETFKPLRLSGQVGRGRRRDPIQSEIAYTCTNLSTSRKVEIMKIMTYSEARSSLKTVLDAVHDDADVTVISRRDGADAVVMSLDHYQSIMETMHLLSTPANAAHLAKSIAQHKAGKAVRRELARV